MAMTARATADGRPEAARPRQGPCCTDQVLSVEVRPGSYHDSIVLMVASARMLDVDGVRAAMAAMATPLNLAVLRESGLWDPALETAAPDDLVLAALGTDPAAAIRAGETALL